VLDVVVDSRLMVGLARLSALVVAGQLLVEDAKRVLAQSKAESQRVTRSLAESRVVVDRVTRVLRRAGYHV